MPHHPTLAGSASTGVRGITRFVCCALLAAIAASSKVAARDIQIVVTDTALEPVADAILFADSVKPALANMSPAIIDQINREFVPLVNVIQQGQSVIFPNSDNIRHHVYSFSTPKVFEIQLYEGVPNTPIVFDKPGIVALGCNIHDTMVGYIVVAPGDVFAKTEANGTATLNVVTKPATINLWHPALAADKSVVKTIALPAPSADGNIHIQLELAANPPASKNSNISRLRSLRRAN